MNKRHNEGFDILISQPLPDNEEIVLGLRQSDNSWVVWYCYNKCNYYWGAYYDDLVSALKKFIERCDAHNPSF